MTPFSPAGAIFSLSSPSRQGGFGGRSLPAQSRTVQARRRSARPLSPLWRGGSHRLGRSGFLLLATAGHRQQERSLAAVGNSLGARGLARGRLLRRLLRVLREAALERLHQIDDLGRLLDLARRPL